MSFILNSGRFGAAVDPGLSLLQSATLWLDASDDIANAQWIRNKGTGGRSLDAREGSVGSAQIVKGALKLPGVANNNVSVPDSAAISSTSTYELITRVAFADYTGSNLFAVKRGSGASDRDWQFDTTANTIRFIGFLGASNTPRSVSISGLFTGGTAYWFRVTADGSNTTFYYAADQTSVPSSWTQIGAAQASVGTMNDATPNVEIGGSAALGSWFAGTHYRFILRTTIGGANQLDMDFTAVSDLATSFTESSSNAATVTLSSTTGVDTNDPLLLTHTGTNYLYLPGIAGNNCTVPSSSALNVTGSIDIRARVALADWTPSAAQTIVCKRASSGTDFSYEFRVSTGGTLLFAWGSDASTYNEEASSAAPTVSDGQAIWLRVTRDTSTGDVIFYQAADSSSMPGSWTQIGTTQASTPSAIYGSTNNLNIGAFYHTSPNFGLLAGNLYRVLVYNGIAGTIVFDADFSTNTDQSSFTESSSNAATVTINRATSGRKSVMVTRPVWLFGTDDYMEIADNALLDFGAAQDFTVLATIRTHASWANDDRFVSKRNNAGGLGYVLANAGSSGLVQAFIQHGGGSGADTQTPYTIGVHSLLSGVRSGSDVTMRVGTTGTATTISSADLSNAVALRVGADPDGANYLDGEITHVAVFRSALTSTELGQIATYLGV